MPKFRVTIYSIKARDDFDKETQDVSDLIEVFLIFLTRSGKGNKITIERIE